MRNAGRVRDLIALIHDLPAAATCGGPSPANPHVWFLRHRHHVVFFRELSGGIIGVISILHENMHLPARLNADADRSAEE